MACLERRAPPPIFPCSGMPRAGPGMAFCLWLGLLSCSEGWADNIYAFVDDAGITHFSNVPQDRRYRLFLRSPESGLPAPPGAVGRPPSLPQRRLEFVRQVSQASVAGQVPPALVHAVISTESGYNPNALSRKGAMGLMQLMPDTARRYSVVDPYDPTQNIRGGVAYLRDLIQQFNNDLPLVLAAYNAGEGAVQRHGNRIPPYAETQQYVPRVLGLYDRYRYDPSLHPPHGSDDISAPRFPLAGRLGDLHPGGIQ